MEVSITRGRDNDGRGRQGGRVTGDGGAEVLAWGGVVIAEGRVARGHVRKREERQNTDKEGRGREGGRERRGNDGGHNHYYGKNGRVMGVR